MKTRNLQQLVKHDGLLEKPPVTKGIHDVPPSVEEKKNYLEHINQIM